MVNGATLLQMSREVIQKPLGTTALKGNQHHLAEDYRVSATLWQIPAICKVTNTFLGICKRIASNLWHPITNSYTNYLRFISKKYSIHPYHLQPITISWDSSFNTKLFKLGCYSPLNVVVDIPPDLQVTLFLKRQVSTCRFQKEFCANLGNVPTNSSNKHENSVYTGSFQKLF